MFVCGIDLGTQGARVIVADLEGAVKVETSVPFPGDTLQAGQPGYFEQDPSLWRQALFQVLSEAIQQLRAAGESPEAIATLSVTSTSGTLCLVDDSGSVVRPAIMYSDSRAAHEADDVQSAGAEIAAKLGSRFAPSYAISKLRWLQQHEPASLQKARWFLSPADLVNAWLSGIWGVTDWTNALKWGYDVVDLNWPQFIFDRLGFENKFPAVRAPGSLIGRISIQAAAQTGLSTNTVVIAGATDGTASQFASGAVSPGQWNSTLGTTLVLKGVSERIIRDPLGRVYCHRHPEGYWLPGGASSTGADCIAQRFSADRLPALNQAAFGLTPTDLIIYPLIRRGERFPFDKPEAIGFTLGDVRGEETNFTAHLEGIAYVERLAYEVLSGLGAEVSDAVCAVGGATQSSAGLQIRADVLQKRMVVPMAPSGAMGAAILAARGCCYPSVKEAVGHMVHWHTTIEPRAHLAQAYNERYQRFLAACRERGYIA
ncbi:MAG: FGGY-family carbohydrate kinase [Chloroflexi bacterium]|nr:FGGY-family carbohydrate kinase [Chloroflexota bacterium]